MLKIRSERGDTIVEVMIALTVLASAFSIAYATANKSLQGARNAQEHSVALQHLNSQIELARIKAPDNSLYTAGAFCMDTAPGPNHGRIVRPVDASCTIGPLEYKVSITHSGTSQDIFTFSVNWDGPGDSGTQTKEIFYKIHKPKP